MTDPVTTFRGKKAAKAKQVSRVGFAVLSAISFVLLALVTFWLFGPGPRAKEGDNTIFVVSIGDGVSVVAKRLADEELVRSSLAFRIVAGL